MRFINKKYDPTHGLSKANETPPESSENATTRWKSFKKHKTLLGENLKKEQYFLCAYSEIRPDEVGLGVHIEHVELKSDSPFRTFDYTNLVLSSFSSDDLKKYDTEEIFGGHAREKTNDSEKFISSLEPDCSRYFSYSSTGGISPVESLSSDEKDKARYTIEQLNLNCEYLTSERKKWLDELDGIIDEHIAKGYSLLDLATIYLTPCNRKLYRFFSVSRQRFGLIADKIEAL